MISSETAYEMRWGFGPGGGGGGGTPKYKLFL